MYSGGGTEASIYFEGQRVRMGLAVVTSKFRGEWGANIPDCSRTVEKNEKGEVWLSAYLGTKELAL